MTPIIQLEDRLQDFYDVFQYWLLDQNTSMLILQKDEITEIASRVFSINDFDLERLEVRIDALKEKCERNLETAQEVSSSLFYFFEKIMYQVKNQTEIVYGEFNYYETNFSQIRENAPSLLKFVQKDPRLPSAVEIASLVPSTLDPFFLDMIFNEILSSKKPISITFSDFLIMFGEKTLDQSILYIELLDSLELLDRFEAFVSDFSEWALQFIEEDGENIEKIMDYFGHSVISVFIPKLPAGLFVNCLEKLFITNREKAKKLLDVYVKDKKGLLLKFWKSASFFSNNTLLYLISKRKDFRSLFYDSDDLLPAFLKLTASFPKSLAIKVIKHLIKHPTIVARQKASLVIAQESFFSQSLSCLLHEGIKRYTANPKESVALKLKKCIALFLEDSAIQNASIEKRPPKSFYLQKLMEAQILIEDAEGLERTLEFRGLEALEKDLHFTLLITLLNNLGRYSDPKKILQVMIKHPIYRSFDANDTFELLSYVIGLDLEASLKLFCFNLFFDHDAAFLIKGVKLLELFHELIVSKDSGVMTQKILMHPSCFFIDRAKILELIALAQATGCFGIRDVLKKLL
jgi:hypothetical protein